MRCRLIHTHPVTAAYLGTVAFGSWVAWFVEAMVR